MATIEERAQAYLQSRYDGGDYWFDAAEQWLRTQLLRWRDPKEELPEEGVPVLAKFHNGTYAVLLRYNHPRLGWGWTFDSVGIIPNDSQIIGWRPIEENQ